MDIANRRLKALVNLKLQITSERKPRRLLNLVCRSAHELIEARHGVLAIRDQQDGESHLVSRGLPAQVVAKLSYSLVDKGLLGALSRKGGRCDVRTLFCRLQIAASASTAAAVRMSQRGPGVQTMRERAAGGGATVQVLARPGADTQIVVRAPLHSKTGQS